MSGFLSLVPYVGLPLAMTPALAAGLIVYDQPAIYVMIAVVVAMLHLVAMNLLYPKVVGSRVHLNPLVVTVALMFWGTLWGGIGLLLAIPITAGIKAVCDNVTSLHGYGNCWETSGRGSAQNLVMSKRLLIFFGVGLVAIAIAVVVILSGNKGSHLELQGKIMKVRTGALGEGNSIAVMDFRVKILPICRSTVRNVEISLSRRAEKCWMASRYPKPI